MEIIFFMVKALLFILLSNYSMVTTPKHLKVTLEYASTLDVAYMATFNVTYNTPSGQVEEVVNVISPVGTTGSNTTLIDHLPMYTLDHYELVGYSEYYQ